MMDQKTKLNYELAAAWGGIVFFFLYPLFWFVIGHMQPPLSYTATPAQIAAFYQAKQHDVVFGMAMAAISAGLWITFTAQATVTIWRIEGDTPMLTIASLIGGVLTAWAFISGPVMWLGAAFRSDADPQIIRALSDSAYLMFNSTYIITTVQSVAQGLVGLHDKSPTPAFPRWVSWIAILCGLSLPLVSATPLVFTGPFALDGWAAGWIPGSMVFIWCGTSSYAMIRDVMRRKRALG